MSFQAKVVIGVCFGLLVIGVAATRWKAAGKSLLFILIFEGVFRKWLLPSASDFIYFFKDWVLIGTVLGMYQSHKLGPPINWRALPFWLWLLGFMALLQTLNPTMASPVAGIMGAKGWMLWTLFIFVVPRLFDDIDEFRDYVTKLAVVFLGVGALAVVQFRLPESHILNQYVREQEGIASFGERGFVRVCATFPYLSGFTNYLAFCPVLFLPAAIYFRGRMAGVMQYLVIPLLLAVSSMSGARATLYYLGVFIPVFLVIGAATGAIAVSRIVNIIVITGVLALGLLLTNNLFRDAIQALLERNELVTQGNDTPVGRTFSGFVDAFSPGMFSWAGEGIGATAEAARNIANLSGLPVAPSERYAESEPGRVMIETGVIGFFVWNLFKAYLFALAFVMYRERKSALTRAISLGVFLYLVILIAAAPIFDHTLAPFYWFNLGLLFLMEKFDATLPVMPLNLHSAPGSKKQVRWS